MEESENIYGNYLAKFPPIWIEFGILLGLIGVMNLIVSLCCPSDVQGRDSPSCDFVEENFNVDIYSNIYKPTFFNSDRSH